ncbi:MAG: ATP-binding protein [Propionibacteriaceae bacterium]|jgi:predicted AAA+ superfamily ATPase|nr:ATP-binding protein [Propionibacteriaceae bacterium]
MRRLLTRDLIAWKNKVNRLPLILRGARQVGKTWLLNEFGRTEFDDVLYINFENASDLREVFDGDISPHRIIDLLGALHGTRIKPHDTLLIFDEVQEVPRALTSLKYFAEQAPEYAICCAGSLLGVALHSGTSFPVGKVDFLTLQPLTFEEFLLANGEDALIDYVRDEGLAPIPQAIANKLTDYLKFHFVIGGMPGAVEAWLDTRDFSEVEERQRGILTTYENDFSKHAPSSIVPKLRYLWDSVPSQLARENKKFVYGLVREGARAREYEEAMLWLLDSGLLRKVTRVTKAALPLKAYEDLKAFKLYHLDVGLLRVMSELPPAAILNGASLFEEFKGALTEQFVLTELLGQESIRSVHYWSSDATAEVDFVFSQEGDIYPVEVKSGENLRSRSLKVYRDRYSPRLALRTSLSNLRLDDGLLNVPLFALFNVENYLRVSK